MKDYKTSEFGDFMRESFSFFMDVTIESAVKLADYFAVIITANPWFLHLVSSLVVGWLIFFIVIRPTYISIKHSLTARSGAYSPEPSEKE